MYSDDIEYTDLPVKKHPNQVISDITNIKYIYSCDVYLDDVKVAKFFCYNKPDAYTQPYEGKEEEFTYLDNLNPDIDTVVNKLFKNYLVKQELEKLKELSKTHLIIISKEVYESVKQGNIIDLEYRSYDFKTPNLKEIDLQTYKDLIVSITPDLKDDKMILNEVDIDSDISGLMVNYQF